MRLATALLVALLLPNVTRGQSAPPPVRIDNGDQVATDDLGRSLPTPQRVGPPKAKRWVGLFYWQWHTGLRATPQYDMTAFLAGHPKFVDFLADPPGGPKNPTWYWAQPLWGYYRSDDPYVVRRHLPLIAAAGIDFLFLDYTNSTVYDRELTAYLKVSDELKAGGLAVPKLTFFLNHESDRKVESLYVNWYKPGHHKPDWFVWDGKPLLMSPMPTDASKLKDPKLLPEIQRYFTWRPTWALERCDRDKHLWRFLSTPTDPPALGPDGDVEQMAVCKSMGGPIWSAVKDGGVSWSGAKDSPKHTPKDYNGNWLLPDAARGTYFQAEWDHAMKVAPPILLVTGWNEWTASVWDRPGVVMLGRTTGPHQGHIVDEFNMQFDRDIEPMAPTGPGQPEGYGDDYYWQFVQNMRRYKGVVPPASPSPAVMTPINWDYVTPVYHDTVHDVGNRDHAGNPTGVHLTDTTARNDLAAAQVGRSGSTITFRLTTAGPLKPPTADHPLTLLIDADQSAATGWHGYDLRIMCVGLGPTAAVERYVGGNWMRVGQAESAIGADGLTLTLGRDVVRMGRPGPERFDFKWADNLPPDAAVWDFYTHGDVAPDGRFNYRYDVAD